MGCRIKHGFLHVRCVGSMRIRSQGLGPVLTLDRRPIIGVDRNSLYGVAHRERVQPCGSRCLRGPPASRLLARPRCHPRRFPLLADGCGSAIRLSARRAPVQLHAQCHAHRDGTLGVQAARIGTQADRHRARCARRPARSPCRRLRLNVPVIVPGFALLPIASRPMRSHPRITHEERGGGDGAQRHGDRRARAPREHAPRRAGPGAAAVVAQFLRAVPLLPESPEHAGPLRAFIDFICGERVRAGMP